MPVRMYNTNKGKFKIDSNRELSPEELQSAIGGQGSTPQPNAEKRPPSPSVGGIVSGTLSTLAPAIPSILRGGAETLATATPGISPILSMLKKSELDKQTEEIRAGALRDVKRGEVDKGTFGLEGRNKDLEFGDVYQEDFGLSPKKAAVAGLATEIVTNPVDLIMGIGEAKIASKTGKEVGSLLGLGKDIGKEFIDVFNKTKTGKVVKKAGEKVTSLFKDSNILKRSDPAYLRNDILPKTIKVIRDNVTEFGMGVQKFAKETLGFSDDSIGIIRRQGVKKLQKEKNRIGDVENIYKRIDDGFTKKAKIADDAYDLAEKSADNYIQTTKVHKAAKRYLKGAGVIDELGNPLFTESMTPGEKVVVAIYQQTLEKGKVPKSFFKRWRRLANKEYKDPATRMIRNAIYKDMEDSGAKGLKVARKLEAKKFKMEKQFVSKFGDVKGVGGERKLANYKKFTSVDKGQLADMEKYIGDKVTDDLKVLGAYDDFTKLGEFNIDKVFADLRSASDEAVRPHIKLKYKDILGDYVDDVFGELKKHKASTRHGRRLKSILSLGFSEASEGGSPRIPRIRK